MNPKVLFSVVAIFFFSVISFAQNKDFEVKVSPKNADSNMRKKSVSVIIVKKDSADFDSKESIKINFYLSKCSILEKCNTRNDVFVAYKFIDGKKLKTEKVLVFDANFTTLHWKDEIISVRDQSRPNNFSKVPKDNNHFYVVIEVADKSKTSNGKSVIHYKEYTSNEIIVGSNQ